MKDQDIIDGLRSADRGKALKALYKEWPKVKALIQQSGGTKEEAQEVFNDALLLLVEKVNVDDFKLTSKLSSFLYGIARFLWMNELRRSNRKKDLEWSDTLIISAEDLSYDYEKEEKIQKLEQLIGVLSKKCQEIFSRFYFKKERMKDIAAALGFSNVNSAKTQKYKCMEHAIKLANDPAMLNQKLNAKS